MGQEVRKPACVSYSVQSAQQDLILDREKNRQAKSVFQVEMQYKDSTQCAVTTRMNAFA